MDNLSRPVSAGLLISFAAILAVACGGSTGSAPPTVAPVVTGTMAVTITVTPAVTADATASQHPIEPCPNQSVCDLGHGLAAALKDGDASFILSHWQGKNYTCPGTPARVAGRSLSATTRQPATCGLATHSRVPPQEVRCPRRRYDRTWGRRRRPGVLGRSAPWAVRPRLVRPRAATVPSSSSARNRSALMSCSMSPRSTGGGPSRSRQPGHCSNRISTRSW